jgi:cyclopropane-fatty-acyl-phospholipid synthase
MPITQLISPLIGFAEAGRLPDSIVRTGMRRLLRARLAAMEQGGVEAASDATNALLRDASASPIAVVPELANEQHYEVPAAFFKAALGPHLKYSCCHWANGSGQPHSSSASDGNATQDAATLGNAEESALRLTCEHAGLSDGQRILELGCGWGSLSLWMAAEYPNSRITAISNSGSQRAHIVAEAQERGLNNLDVQTCDINDFEAPAESFDRVVSVEMFEHVRNHSRLMSKIHNWLTPGGQLFVHIFCHRTTPYLFEDDGPASWMARTFFSGGMMPSQDWLLRCQHPLQLDQQWSWNGRHYERTCNAWLARMDQRHEEVAAILQQTYGDSWRLWRQRWRMFFMACAELFGLADGNEWFVTHMRFNRAI